MTMTMSARSIRRGLGHCLKAPPARPTSNCNPPRIVSRNFSPAILGNNEQELTAITQLFTPTPHDSFLTGHNHHHHHRSLSSSSKQTLEQRRHSILTHALQRVHDEGWTDDAIATGTLDAGLPPSYIGQARNATSSFGSADLVVFFMDECNASLRNQLTMDEQGQKQQGGNTLENVSSCIHKALQMRLSMVLPFVASNRWHEGMAIGALPQNAYKTTQQLDDMANIVLNYALGNQNANNNNPTQRAAIIAAYAAAELHLLSDGKNGTVSGNSLSLSGEQYHATWSFLEDRSAEVARLIVDGGVNMPFMNGVSLPNPTHVMAASAVASSLAGAALSLMAPSAAAVAGHILPRAMMSLQNVVGSQMSSNANQRDGTHPSDYSVATETLPPFDANEEIFSGNSGKAL